MTPEDKERARIANEAALRLVRLHDGNDDAARKEFLEWSRLSAHHVHELLMAQATSRELERIDPARQIDVDALPTPPEFVDSIEGVADKPERRARIVQRRWVAALAAALVGIIFAWLLLPNFARAPGHFETARGEQRSIKLEDGSVIVLNTDSRLSVQFSDAARAVRLHSGEALFSVQREATRPFRVVTDAGTVTVIGTQFNVRALESSTRIAVVEGVVQLADQTRIEAGYGAVMKLGQQNRAERIDISQAVAWRSRQLVFRDAPLAHAAAEFNRYNAVRIEVEGVALEERGISGVFDADDYEPLVRFLEHDPGVTVERGKDRIVIRGAQ